MKIKDLPNSSRPRERFLKHGKEALSDSELIALILRTGTRDENVIDMCNRLINEYKLENLFDCSLNELQKIKGIGQTKAIQLLAISELGKRYSQSKTPITRISCAKDVYKYFKDILKNEKQENFYVLTLTTKNIIINKHLITKGVLDSAIIHPREVFRPAIRDSASKIILIHNHPSGDPQPSEEDLDITKRILELGKQMDIKVLDHVIIGSKGNTEYAGDKGNTIEENEIENGWWSWVEDSKTI